MHKRYINDYAIHSTMDGEAGAGRINQEQEEIV